MELDVRVRVDHARTAWFYDNAQRTNLGLIAKHGVADPHVARTAERA
tara:strand:+ start:300 stop:440 length:141 start_codon:yes stop_codon:yes gene_type:complete